MLVYDALMSWKHHCARARSLSLFLPHLEGKVLVIVSLSVLWMVLLTTPMVNRSSFLLCLPSPSPGEVLVVIFLTKLPVRAV